MRRRILILICLIFLAGMLWPQSPAGPRQSQTSTPVVKVQTRLVIIDVVAQDKSGRPVRDLQGSDFKVLEDGKEQAISVFAFQHPGVGPEQPAAKEPLPENVFGNAPHFNSKRALNVVLLDALNTNLLNQAYVHSQLVSCLEKLPQGQPIAIYALGNRLRLLQDFTTDLTELKSVILKFKGQSSHALNKPVGAAEIPSTLQGAAAAVAANVPGMTQEIEAFARDTSSSQMDLRVGSTTAALTALARMLAGYPGRKNLIWVTEAVPIHVFPDPKDAAHSVIDEKSYDHQLALLANLFADAQVSVYPIDARGLIGDSLFNVANNVGADSSGTIDPQIIEAADAHSTMEDIAAKTGGRAFYNRNNIDGAIIADMQDGSTYYTLGYYPSNKAWDGKFRKIRINFQKGGVTLRYRQGYYAIDRAEYDKSHPQQRDLDFSQALEPNSPVATALQFEVGILPSPQGPQKLLVRYLIDPHALNFETQPDGLNHAEVDCAARVFSPKDVDHPVITVGNRAQANVKQDVYKHIRSAYFPCEVTLDLPPGSYLLRVAVRDNLTGLMGSANARAIVPVNQASTSTKSAQ